MNKFVYQLAIIATLLGFVSCSSTTVEEVATSGEESSEVTVTAKAPVFNTRATSGYVLRYKAFLFEEIVDEDDETKSMGNVVAVQEKLDNNGAQFSFIVDEPGDYVILFVADYILTSAQPNKNIWIDGKQVAVTGNKYHDTSSCYSIDFNQNRNRFLVMNTEEKAPYNNDNYEVFTGKVSFKKGNDKITVSPVTLKRPVCKIIVAEKEEEVDALTTNITKFNAGVEYDLYKETVSAPRVFENENEENGFLRTNISIADTDNKELFYFYAFANSGENATSISENGLGFTLKGGAVDFKYTITADKLSFKPNHKYTLMGNFVRTDMGQVNITVKTDPSWDSESDQNI